MPGAKRIPLAPTPSTLYCWPDDNREVSEKHLRAAYRRKRNRGKLGRTKDQAVAAHHVNTVFGGYKKPRASDVRKSRNQD